MPSVCRRFTRVKATTPRLWPKRRRARTARGAGRKRTGRRRRARRNAGITAPHASAVGPAPAPVSRTPPSVFATTPPVCHDMRALPTPPGTRGEGSTLLLSSKNQHYRPPLLAVGLSRPDQGLPETAASRGLPQGAARGNCSCDTTPLTILAAMGAETTNDLLQAGREALAAAGLGESALLLREGKRSRRERLSRRWG
jgi:hypothetical protein